MSEFRKVYHESANWLGEWRVDCTWLYTGNAVCHLWCHSVNGLLTILLPTQYFMPHPIDPTQYSFCQLSTYSSQSALLLSCNSTLLPSILFPTFICKSFIVTLGPWQSSPVLSFCTKFKGLYKHKSVLRTILCCMSQVVWELFSLISYRFNL